MVEAASGLRDVLKATELNTSPSSNYTGSDGRYLDQLLDQRVRVIRHQSVKFANSVSIQHQIVPIGFRV